MSEFIEKERALLARLKETDYDVFDDADEAFEYVEKRLMSFPRYVNIVTEEMIKTEIWNRRYEGQVLRDKKMDIDGKRRILHNSAIDSINQLNRLSESLGLGIFADVDTADRHAVAEYAGQIVNIVYNEGIGNEPGKAFDNAVMKSKDFYDDSAKPKDERKYVHTGKEDEHKYDEKRMAEEIRKLDAAYAQIQAHANGPSTQMDI